MKKQYIITSVLLSSLMLNSCQPILRTILGYKKISLKTTEEVTDAAKEYELVGGVHAALTYSGVQETHSGSEFVPTIRYELFNRDGVRVVKDSSKYSGCSNSETKFLIELDQPEKSMVVGDQGIETIIKRLCALDGSPLKFNTSPSEYDFTAFIYWADFAGKHNFDIAEWLESIQQHEELQVLVVFVNSDKRTWWDEPEAEEMVAQ